MEKKILKHLTVRGFVKGTDLTNCELMEKKLDNAKAILRIAKREVKLAKQRLNKALEEALNKIATGKNEIIESQYKLVHDPVFSSVFSVENMKTKNDERIQAGVNDTQH